MQSQCSQLFQLCRSWVGTASVLSQVGIETEPRHDMLTVRSSASGGCHATSCPYKEGGGGGREGKGSRKGGEYLPKQPIEKKSNKKKKD